MRGRRALLVLSLVVVLVAAGFGAEQLLVARHHDLLARRQQADYRAGHAAYLTGDCRTAIPALGKADIRRFSDLMAQQARTEQAACQQFLEISGYAGQATPALAAAVYVDYLRGDRPPPLARAAQRRARQLLTASLPYRPIGELCDAKADLERFGLILMKPDDVLAAPFLRACVDDWAGNGYWSRARTALLQLMHEFPRTAEGRSALKDLVALSFTTARIISPNKMTVPSKARLDASLHGKARLQVFYNSRLEFSAAGEQNSLVQMAKCKACLGVSRDSLFNACAKHAPSATIDLMPGRYRVQIRYLDETWLAKSKADLASAAKDEKAVHWVLRNNVTFAPNQLYEICFD